MPKKKAVTRKKANQKTENPQLESVRVSNVYFNRSQKGRGYWKLFFEDGRSALLFDSKLAQELGLTQERAVFRPPKELRIQTRSGQYGLIIEKAGGSLKQTAQPQDNNRQEEIIRMSVLRTAVEAMPMFTNLTLPQLIEKFTEYIKTGQLPSLD